MLSGNSSFEYVYYILIKTTKIVFLDDSSDPSVL